WEPAEIQIDSAVQARNYGRAFQFIVNDKDHYKFYSFDDPGNASNLYEFGQTVDYQGLTFRAVKRRNYDYSRILNQEFTFALRNPNRITVEYTNRLAVIPSPDGSVLDIALLGTIPSKEIDFIKKLIEVYIDDELERKNEQATKTINFISKELKRITDSLNLIESRKTSFRQQRSAQLSQSAVQLYSRLDDVEMQSAQVENKLAIYNQLLSTINSSYNFDDLSGLAAIGIDDGGLKQLINDLVSEQERIDQAERGTGQNTNNPYIKRARDNVERLKTSISESVNNLAAATKQTKSRLDSRANKIRREIYAGPGAQQSLVNIERVNLISENLYILYNTKRAEAEVAKASASTDIQVIDPPMRIGGAEKSDKRNYLIAFFLGITLPLGFIIGKDFLSNKVAEKEDIERNTNIPILGQIWRYAKGKSMLVVHNNPKSVVSESFRSVRSNLNFFTSDVNQKIFVVTSSVSGEGKTFSSVNLATVFAFSSKKVILVGADLRRPKIFGDFGLKNDIGLSNFLAGSAFKSEIIQSTEIPYLDIISSGPVPPNPSELLMNSKMGELVNELKKDYDYILIDTAPLGLVTDAFILMNHAHHTIFLVRQNYTPLEAIKNVQDLYESGKLKNVSILFNDVKDQSNNYGYGYGYYQDKGR
ncbi:MAG: polysaccharide biosynthesis tyrosine autokinase, partial [Leptolyngbya sp. SIO1D8]|nr:polysaccharide biosynthesis tyrosine autokinase [Leptolyngbya sp. SIO1D8]